MALHQRHAERSPGCRRHAGSHCRAHHPHLPRKGPVASHARILSPPVRHPIFCLHQPDAAYTVNTIDEHLDMLMVCHHLDPDIAEDVAFAESRIHRNHRRGRRAARYRQRFSPPPQIPGRWAAWAEVIIRTAAGGAPHVQVQRALPEETGADNDNFRVKRYVAKYTINPWPDARHRPPEWKLD